MGQEGVDSLLIPNFDCRLRLSFDKSTIVNWHSTMILKRLGSYFFGTLLGMLLISCTAATSGTNNSPLPTPNTNQQDTSAVSTSVEELGKLVNLTEHPSSVVWRKRTLGAANSSVPGPTDWQLEAVLTFDQPHA